jgi:hypothetical protein
MTEATTISVHDFLTAGLEDEGIYRLRINKMEVVERTGENGPFKQISGQVELVEQFGEGLIEYPAREFFNASIKGKGLERFRNLYVAAMGEMDGSAPGDITLDDLAAALVGNESVWTTYYWRRNRKNPNEIEGSLGYSFSQDPNDIRAPRPFAERDNQ